MCLSSSALQGCEAGAVKAGASPGWRRSRSLKGFEVLHSRILLCLAAALDSQNNNSGRKGSPEVVCSDPRCVLSHYLDLCQLAGFGDGM